MSIRILVNGAFGKMGQQSVIALSEHPGLEVVGQTGRDYDLKAAILDSKAQVVLDFTHADAVFTNINTIIEAGAHPVIGTSGLKSEQIRLLQEKCASLKLGGLIVPNFSLGGIMMMRCAKEIVKYLPHAAIIEMHHDGKKDSPSGTSMRTAAMMADACKTVNQPSKPSDEVLAGSLGADYHGVPIHAIRLPGVLAYQQIIFGNAGETLTVTHNSLDRQSFMPGVCLACERVVKLDKLIYGLEEIL